MQHRYTGDVGDFGKVALLRALSPGRSLGVCWYLCDGRGETSNDGMHLGYVDQPKRFRALDPHVFDAMRAIVGRIRQGAPRELGLIERSRLLDGAVFHREPVPASVSERTRWFHALGTAVDGCDLLFLDPDNGFEPAHRSPKCVGWDELRALRRPGRSLLVYHHQTRFKGGAKREATHLRTQLRRRTGAGQIDVIRLRPGTSRFYVLIDGSETLRLALAAFAHAWHPEAELLMPVEGSNVRINAHPRES